ncbi:MAG: sulfatase [Cyclobacteriaceae bacterium]
MTLQKTILYFAFSFIALLKVSLPLSAQNNQEQKKMNILFIAVDDLNNDLGGYGHPLVKSPNIDRLMQRGVRFEKAYCQFPLCSPSRVSLLTGLRPDTTQVFDLKTEFRDNLPSVTTLPEFFKDHGYFSARVGKIFHFGVPGGIGTNGLDDPQSWDKVINPMGRDKIEEAKIINLTPNRGLGSSLAWLASEGTDDEQTDGMVAIEAIRLMKENKDKPFFIAAGFYRPHCPYVAPKKYFEMYPVESITLPEEPAAHFRTIPKPALWTNPLYWGLNELGRKEAIRAYYASITFMDTQLGKLLDALDQLGLADNTIVVFWSDHGYLLTEHGQWMKQSLFEESARVPLIIAAPHAKGNGKASKRVVELVDLYPTLAHLCELQPPGYLAGNNLMPLLKKPNKKWKSAAYTQVLRNPENFMGRSVRTERWRYTEWDHGKKGVELYDHTRDPNEYNNLAVDPDFVKIRDEMGILLNLKFQK